MLVHPVRRQSAAGDASVVFKIWLYFVQVGLLIVQARSGGGRVRVGARGSAGAAD
jgi:hypothetical protein